MQDNDRPGALSAVRAFGVMAGGTFVPNLAAAVSVSSVARFVAHNRDGAAATHGDHAVPTADPQFRSPGNLKSTTLDRDRDRRVSGVALMG